MRLGAIAGALATFLLGPPAWAASPFADWAAIIVAGDYRSHDGNPAETFDNARRDLMAAFVDAGFDRQNMQQFSVRPRLYPDAAPLPSELGLIKTELERLASKAKGGCLVYFTSHGSPDGAVVGNNLLTPQGAKRMLADTCGERPTVVVISACFSGVFVPELASSNRMILTAARPDRTSFGCGETDRYPYFDACMLETIPGATDFAILGRQAQACVKRKETEAKVGPPSEPQMAVGGELRPMLPLLSLHQR